MKKKTNPLGKGTKNLCVNFKSSDLEALVKQAKRNGIRLSEYSRLILNDSVARNVIVTKTISLEGTK